MTPWIAAAAVLFLACGGGKPDRLSRGDLKLARVVAELTLLRERMPPPHPAYKDSARALLLRRRISPEGFSKRIARIDEQPERWAAFYREVKTVIEASKSSAAAPR